MEQYRHLRRQKAARDSSDSRLIILGLLHRNAGNCDWKVGKLVATSSGLGEPFAKTGDVVIAWSACSFVESWAVPKAWRKKARKS